MVTRKRASLNPSNVEKLVCMASWHSIGDFDIDYSDDDVKEFMREAQRDSAIVEPDHLGWKG